MPSPSLPPSTPTVMLTIEQLDRLIQRAVTKALAAGAPAEGFLTTAETAKRLGLHPKTVARLVRVGGLPAHRVGGTEYRFKASEVDAWLLARDAGKRH